jgi:hypothetical protein
VTKPETWQEPVQKATPFWRRMPKFFLFPLQTAALTRVAAVGGLVAAAVATEAWVLIVAAALVSLVFIARFGFVVIERTAQGFLRVADYPKHFEQGSPYRPYKLFGIYMVAGVAAAAIEILTRSAFLGFIASVLLSLMIPAAAMQLTLTDSFAQSIHPTRVLDIALRIGPSYLVLCAFLVLLQISSMIAFSTFQPLFGKSIWATFGLLAFIVSYFWLIMCAMTGYVMYQYSDALELTVIGPGESSARPATMARVNVAARARDALIGRMVAAGEIKEAIDALSEDLRERPSDLSLHGRLHKLLLIEGSTPRIEDHAERYLDLLLKTDNAREALPLVEAAFKRNANWEPRRLEHVVPLARAALGAGKPQLTAQLIRGFDKKHKMHADIPHVYLLGAQLLIASGASAQQARPILEHLLRNHPLHPAANEAKRTLERLAHLADRTAGAT